MKISWNKLAMFGLATTLFASGCVITSGDDDDNSGGKGGTSNAGSGGTSNAGTGGTSTAGTGGTNTAGTGGTNTGGTGGTQTDAYLCDPDVGDRPTPTAKGSCEELDSADTCGACLKANCCAEWETCGAEGPGDPCAYGGQAGEGEIFCIVDYIRKETESGERVLDNALIDEADAACYTLECDLSSAATSGMLGCMINSCEFECLSGL